MKEIKNPFVQDSFGQIYVDTKGNYFFKGGYDKYIRINEVQIFNDFGDVSYEYLTGNNVK